MDKATHEERETAIREWREAGDHLKTATSKLVEAFQTGWSGERPQTERRRLSEDLRAVAQQLEHAARSVREMADKPAVRDEIDQLGAATKRAATDTEKVIRKDFEYVTEAFDQPEKF